MSKVKIQQPIVHIPSFKRWGVERDYVVEVVRRLGLELLYAGVHARYWFTDSEGCSKLIPHLLLKSDLYKKDVFTCINYAYRVWNEGSSKYGLNTWVPVIGRIPGYQPRHAWNLLLIGDATGLNREEFLFLEPNDGFDFSDTEGLELPTYQAFPIGENGYNGELVFL